MLNCHVLIVLIVPRSRCKPVAWGTVASLLVSGVKSKTILVILNTEQVKNKGIILNSLQVWCS